MNVVLENVPSGGEPTLEAAGKDIGGTITVRAFTGFLKWTTGLGLVDKSGKDGVITLKACDTAGSSTNGTTFTGVPAIKVPKDAFVMVIWVVTSMVIVFDAVSNAESVTRKFTGKDPLVDAVPEIAPVSALRTSPSGSPEADHRYGLMPPVAATAAE